MPVAEEVKICPVSMSLLAGIKIWMERWRWVKTGRVEEWNEEYEGECEERKCWIQLVNDRVPGVFLIAAVGELRAREVESAQARRASSIPVH